MSSDQCAQNPDGSLKNPKDIQWFNDKDDNVPIPSSAAHSKPLGRGLDTKTTNRLSDANACEQLGSDEEDLVAFSQPPKCKCATRASAGTKPPTLSSANLFESLQVEESAGDDEEESFNTEPGDESDNQSTDADAISSNEV
jgi:hypothetical protein